MTQPTPTDKLAPTPHSAYREYVIIWGILMVLLVATTGAAAINVGEPWSFLIALAIAVTKAVLVILYFMHVKDGPRITWVFCGASFIWLGIMLALTFGDYLTRPQPPDIAHDLPKMHAPAN